MNNMRKIVSLFLGLVVLSTSVKAWNNPAKAAVSSSSIQAKAAGCTPATGRKILEFNNVSALIETGGSMWQDRSKNDAAYEIPKGSGERVIYAGALWMGGLDVNNQLKLAALTFRSGNDFWTGPLSTIPGTGNLNLGYLDYGPAEIEPDVCVAYDQFYITTRQEIELFNAWFECSNDPDCDVNVDFPGYSIPSSILTWPAHGDQSKFQDFYQTRLWPAFGRQSLVGSSGGYTSHGYTSHASPRACGARLGQIVKSV